MTWTEDHYQLQHVMVFHFLQRSFARPRRCFWHLNNLRPFDIASITIMNIDPRKGPEKSTWILSRGWEGQSNGISGAPGGILRFCWQPSHFFAEDLRSLSIPGHHTKLHPNDFIFTTPKYPSWIWSRTWEHSLVGITTSIPHIKHHWDTVSSSRLAW